MSKEKIWHLFSRKLTGEASQDELMELKLYIEDHPALLHEMDALEQLWMQDNEPDQDYLEATYLLHLEKMKKMGVEPTAPDELYEAEQPFQTSFFNRNRRRLLAGAMFVVIVMAAVIPFLNRKSAAGKLAETTASIKQKVVVTPNGKNTSFQLPDGSTVWLNAGSKIDYSKINEAGNREVYLTGEAFFDVVKNPARPFIIHTSSIDVKVLGTKFNVKAYPEDKTVETSLVQGSVEVFVKNRPGEKYLLKPNQKLVLLNEEQTVAKTPLATTSKKDFNLPIIAITHLTYPKNDTLATETSWTRNKLSFENESFAEIAKKMERWYDVKIIFKNEELENEELNGDFSKETLQQALDALRFTSNSFRYKIEGKTVIIY